MSEELSVRAGTALARDERGAAANILDGVSAGTLGRFPDANAAEALRHVPGVSLEIDQGECRFVVIRVVDASLNNVTLNGQIVGAPTDRRSIHVQASQRLRNREHPVCFRAIAHARVRAASKPFGASGPTLRETVSRHDPCYRDGRIDRR